MDPSEIVVERSSFPNDFIFGVATSEYQVEGARNADGKGNDNIADGRNELASLDHYNMLKEDVALAKKVGLNSYAFSISWSRILPRGKLSGGISKEGIKYYNDLIDTLLAQGIEPWATIFDWDVPTCLEDEYRGFLNSQIVGHFCEFAEICFGEFGNRVKHWITLNEPWTFTYYGYVCGHFPLRATSADETSAEQQTTMEQVMRSSIVNHRRAMAQNLPHHTSSDGDPGTDPYTVAHHLILAHAYAVDIYREIYQERQGGEIGMTNVSTWFYPLRDNTTEDRDAAWRAVDFMLGWFVAPVITGDYPRSMRNHIRKRLPRFSPDEVALVKGSCDFLGINYYTTYYAKHIPRSTSSTPHYDNDRHVENHTHRHGKPIGQPAGSLYIVPEGIYHLMLHIRRIYHNPDIIITENGLDEVSNKALTVSEARIDETRIKYHMDLLACLREARAQGACVEGYFIRSLLDNFDWAQGYNVRCGIFTVDFLHGQLTKFPKRSAMWWRNFLKKPKKVTGVKTDEERHNTIERSRCGGVKN